MSKLHKIVVLSAMLGFAMTASAAVTGANGPTVPNKPVATQSHKAVPGKTRKAKAIKHQNRKKVRKQKAKKHHKNLKKMKRAKKAR